MKAHDGIIFVMIIFLCFQIPSFYRLSIIPALMKQQVFVNNYVDNALEYAALDNYYYTEGKIVWEEVAVIESFFVEVEKLADIEPLDFPVIMFRTVNDIHCYTQEGLISYSLEGSEQQKMDKIKETTESLLRQSAVSQSQGVQPEIYIPVEGGSDWCNSIGEYSVIAILQVKSKFLNDSNIYSVAGVSVVELSR